MTKYDANTLRAVIETLHNLNDFGLHEIRVRAQEGTLEELNYCEEISSLSLDIALKTLTKIYYEMRGIA